MSLNGTGTKTRKAAHDEQQDREADEFEDVLPWADATRVQEPLLMENKDRFVLFPIQHDDIWQFYKKHEASSGMPRSIDLHADLVDWNDKLNDDERYFIKHVRSPSSPPATAS